jgi:hypothetical protein
MVRSDTHKNNRTPIRENLNRWHDLQRHHRSETVKPKSDTIASTGFQRRGRHHWSRLGRVELVRRSPVRTAALELSQAASQSPDNGVFHLRPLHVTSRL